MTVPKFSLKQVSYFVAAADHGTLGDAAVALNISASAVSDAISDLEFQLGAPVLIRRKGQGTLVTAFGAQVLPEARALLAAASDLAHRIEGPADELSGELLIGCMSTLAPFLLPRLIAEFTRLHPRVGVQFFEGSQVQMQQLLRDGRCEAAILYDDSDLAPQFVRTPLYRAQPKILLCGNHPRARDACVRLIDLVGEPLIMVDIPPSRETVKAMFKQHGLSPNTRYSTSHFELARALVARGLGYSIAVQQPRTACSYEGLPIVAIPMADCGVEVTVALFHGRSRPSRPLQAFAALCQRLLDENSDR